MVKKSRYAKTPPRRRPLVAAVLCVLLVAAVAAGAVFWFFSSYTWVDSVRYSRSQAQLDLSGSPLPPMEELEGFKNLEVLDLRDTGLTVQQYDQLSQMYPRCRILWDVPFQGNSLDSSIESLSLSSLTDSEVAMLAYLPSLESLDLTGELPTPALLQELCQAYPGVEISWTFQFGDYSLTQDTTELELSGWTPESAGELEEMIGYAPSLQKLTLLGCGLSSKDLGAVQSAHPELDMVWDITMGTKTFLSTEETLDLSNVPFESIGQLEDLISSMPNLTWIDVSFCGLANEDLDELNRKLENTRIVWTISIGKKAKVRTDEIYFMPTKKKYHVVDADLTELKYCTDMICIDIGHNDVTNIEFVRTMPHLKYLIISDTLTASLEPLRGLQELIYLEAFKSRFTDLSPLLDCPALEDINITLTRADVLVLTSATNLKRLYFSLTYLPSIGLSELKEQLKEALPNTRIEYINSSTNFSGHGWTQHQNYRDMRDVLGMPYFNYG